MRILFTFCAAFAASVASGVRAQDADPAAFPAWVTTFRAQAASDGIPAPVLDRAFQGVTYNDTVIRRDRNQSEFTKTLWDYLDTAVSDARIRSGRAAMTKHADLLAGIETEYGVDATIVAAIWGLESAYGAVRGDIPVIEALATLAFDARRGAFFEGQLRDALRILAARETTVDAMRGSWAGAMGHTQFIPSSYLSHAVDGNGDGRRDIWSDDPSDALASTAAYLKANGWTTGQPWGVEVRLPEGFDYRLANRDIQKLPSVWADLGVTGITGAIADHGRASVLVPAGHRGAAFLIFDNFEVLETYNTADSYVIAVGHLSDRIKGGAAFQGAWPREDRALTYDERTELQRRLTDAGFDPQGIDGKMGPLTINAIREWQSAHDQVPDGYPSLRLLQMLR